MAQILDPDLEGGEERREELFEMIDGDAALKYAWAVPDDRALRVRASASRLDLSPCSARGPACRLLTVLRALPLRYWSTSGR